MASVEVPDRTQPPTGAGPAQARVDRTARRALRLGPLLAVCGLVGGAGATTVAYLTALTAAAQLREPVLVADSGGPSGGLAACAGVESPRSLPELASDLRAGMPPRGELYATDPAGVRVLATGPDFAPCRVHEPIVTLLGDAREAHGLTVVDCGTAARSVDRIVIALATHVVWVIPATRHGVVRGGRVLGAAPRSTGKELVVARCDRYLPKAPLRDLRRIAAMRMALLVLMPRLPGLADGRIDRAGAEAEVALQAIVGALQR